MRLNLNIRELALVALLTLLAQRPIWALECVNLNPSTPAELEEIIRNPVCKVSSIDTLLRVLIHPERPVAAYQSESIQGPHPKDYIKGPQEIDYMNPRNIIGPFGTQEKFLFIAFNGDIHQDGFKSLEVLAVDLTVPKPSADLLHFYDFHFEGEGQNLSWADAQKLIYISNPNPKSCVSCHGSTNARSVYPDYPLWRGMYGSFDLNINPVEQRYWLQFKKSAPSRERYRYLNLTATFDGMSADELVLKGQSNSYLNGELAMVNALRVARLAQLTPDYSKYKYSILGAMIDCREIDQFFPPTMRSKMESNLDGLFKLEATYTNEKSKTILEKIYKLGNDQFGDIPGFSYRPGTPRYSFDEFAQVEKRYWGSSKILLHLWLDTALKEGPQRVVTSPAKMRYVLESRNIDISNWFTDLAQPTYRILGGGTTHFGLALQKDDPDFSAIKIIDDSGDNNVETCKFLKTESLKALH